MLTTVIVPVHNTADYLEECIESILGQSVDVELILVDDASTDDSGLICRRYAANHPEKVSIITTNGVGVSEARNCGIRAAKGEYLCFADSDDVIINGALAHLTAILDCHTECGIAVGQFTQSKKNINKATKTRILTAVDAISDTLYQKTLAHPSAWAKLYRRDIFKDCKLFVAGRRYEDLEIFPRLYMASKMVAVTDMTVYYYRPNPASFINCWTSDRLDTLWATERIGEWCANVCPELIKAATARRFSALYNIFNLAITNSNNELATDVFAKLKELRRQTIIDRNVRLKNKIGALITYAGQGICTFISKVVN